MQENINVLQNLTIDASRAHDTWTNLVEMRKGYIAHS